MDSTAPDLPSDIQELFQALRRGLIEALGDKLFGVYAYGAVAFPESAATGDIDFHVILKDSLDEQERALIQALHAALADAFPSLGADLDGYYILYADARQPAPPIHQLRPEIIDVSWALHRAHLLAGRCIVLYGPPPVSFMPAPDWPELEQALDGELRFVENELDRHPDYCILNLCRLIYSFQTRNVVVSKMASAAWAALAYPEWASEMEMAKRSYARQGTPEEWRSMLERAPLLFSFACRQIDLVR